MFLTDCCLFGAETGYILQSATLYAHFSESKRWAKDFRRSNAAAKANYTCVWLTSDYFELKRVIFFKVKLCVCTFRRRKVPCEDKWSKSRSRDCSPLDNPPTGGFCPKQYIFSSTALTKVTALLLRHIHVTYRKIAARQARGYGVLYEVKPFREKCYFSYTQTVNRTYFYDQLAVAR